MPFWYKLHRYLFGLPLAVIILTSSCRTTQRGAVKSGSAPDSLWSPQKIASFEKKLEKLRQKHHIPSIAVGIVHGRKLAWKKGFGYANVEDRIPPTEQTVYHLASVTKTFGAIILMQLVEAGKVSLDDPIGKYGINLGGRWGADERIKLKHLLTHTAHGHSFNGFKPGYSFRYSGDTYDQIRKAIEKESGRSFARLVIDSIVLPLQLKNTVPNIADSAGFRLTGYEKNVFSRNIAKGYNWKSKKLVPVPYPTYFGPAAGLMSTVADLAVYSVAIDEQRFLKPATWERMFAPFVSAKGKPLRYGLGWFVKEYGGMKVVWHTGLWVGNSSLLIKIPEKDLTFIVLANSKNLSRPFYHFLNPFVRSLNRNLRASAFAEAFLDHFVRP